MKLPYTCMIVRPWEHNDEYVRLIEWINVRGPLIATFGTSYGISYLNGNIYRSAVEFATEEDVLLYKLTFPALN